MISINNVTVSYGGWDLFTDITFIIGENDRIGLVGKNGSGKSTLMKMIIGENNPTSGNITHKSGTTLGYLPQQMNIVDDVTLIDEARKAFKEIEQIKADITHCTNDLSEREDYHSTSYHNLADRLEHLNERFRMLDGDNCEGELEKTLLGLGFQRSDLQRPTREFSGGWRMRIELAKILLRKPDLLLLDEPTNHLDIESIQWLENYLKDYRGALLLISHDRKFLDTVTNRTIEINMRRIHDYRVAYSKYVVLRAERVEQTKAAYENQQKMIKETQDFIDRFRYKPSKSNQVQSRVKQLEKLEIIELEEVDNSRLFIKFPPAPRSGNIIVEGVDVGKSFGEKHIFSDFNLYIERGEKIALVGRNGEGKTTFARMIIGDTEASRGTLRVGHNVDIGYFAQNQDDLMNGDFTVFDTLDKIAVGDIRTKLRDILGAFLFRGEDIDKKVKVLSGGERSRLAMARLMLQPHNVLILDEPTNHLDMRSKDMLKQALNEYDGTLIVVSHDREFLDGLVNKVFEFRDGVVKEHHGGIYDFLQSRNMSMLDEMNLKIKEKSDKPAEPSAAKLSYNEQKEREKILRRIRNDIKKAEEQIAKLESEIAKIDEQLSDPEAHSIDITDVKFFDKYNALKKELSDTEERWTELEIELEETKEELGL